MPDTDPEGALRRTPPRDLQRILLGYLAGAIALLCGVPVLIIGWFAASRCTGEGFRCLGWLIYAMLAAVLVAVVALPFLARRFRLGWLFSLLTIALVATPLVLGNGSAGSFAALLSPGLAAWVSQPRVPDPAIANPLTPRAAPPTPARHWTPRLVTVAVVSILIPLLGRAL
ncbi:MAG: hypothetical protein QM650_03150 [Microlunatus sp.]